MSYLQLFIAKRILLTLAYTEQFEFPLTKSELYSRLLVPFFVEKKLFEDCFELLINKKLMILVDKFLFVKGLSLVKMNNLAKTRIQREKISKLKWKDLNDFVNFAKYIPFITGIAITGSLAVNNTTINDDIDFMVVTSPNRLWISRLIVILFSSIKGKRRSFANEESNSWCFNLWVEESDLQLPTNSRSVYESYEVMQAVWVVSKNNVASRFRHLNSWTKKKINFNKFNYENLDKSNDWSNNLLILSVVLYFVNLIAFYLQFLYMMPHMTREKVTRSHAFFHPRDTKALVFSRWKDTLLRLY